MYFKVGAHAEIPDFCEIPIFEKAQGKGQANQCGFFYKTRKTLKILLIARPGHRIRRAESDA